MSKVNRRDVLKGLGGIGLAGFSTAALPTSAQAQSDDFIYQPDSYITIGGKPIGIDLALLGSNGEETAGFYASLDPFHGIPFNDRRWLTFYGPQLMRDPQNFSAFNPRRLTNSEARNTNQAKIDHIITHLGGHGFRYENDLEPIYNLARQAWQNHPNLRFSSLNEQPAGPERTAFG
ncbi:MAG: hypothetical protein AB8B83_06265 [Bdellovibrionales bacterium]